MRGFDARTGALRWAFDPVPPGTPPLAPAADGTPRSTAARRTRGACSRADPGARPAVRAHRQPEHDFYRGAARGEIDHYGSSLVALRGTTGEVVWHFQTVHHDLWDYDVGAQPTLLDVTRDGVGRRCGRAARPSSDTSSCSIAKPASRSDPSRSAPVPQTDVPGEVTLPTQPFPSFPPPLHPHGVRDADLFGLTPWDRAACREQLAALRNEGVFTPPSLRGLRRSIPASRAA